MPQGVFVCRESVFKIAHLLGNATCLILRVRVICSASRCIPIRSQVCSLAELSLLMMVVGPAGAPLGAAAVWMAGEMAVPFEEEGTGFGPLRRGWM
jgi:hypothetical protein